jgi:hypothetical protein
MRVRLRLHSTPDTTAVHTHPASTHWCLCSEFCSPPPVQIKRFRCRLPFCRPPSVLIKRFHLLQDPNPPPSRLVTLLCPPQRRPPHRPRTSARPRKAGRASSRATSFGPRPGRMQSRGPPAGLPNASVPRITSRASLLATSFIPRAVPSPRNTSSCPALSLHVPPPALPPSHSRADRSSKCAC